MQKGQRRGASPASAKQKKLGKPFSFAAATKSFLGHLEGTAKSKHTIEAYRFDLQSFGEFLATHRRGQRLPDPRSWSRKDLERYHDWLRASGQKSNTRRRKLMTVRKWMHYLTARNKIELDIGKKLPAPEKIERVPATIDAAALEVAITARAGDSLLALRNQALLLLLIDTGATVSEIASLRWASVDFSAGRIRFVGKSERELPLKSKTLSVLTRLSKTRPTEENDDELCFVGYNRHGPIRIGKRPLAITPRGIEMVVKTLADTLGFPGVTPRILRHSTVVAWYREGVAEDEIQRRLGLKTDYAFRIYAPIFARIREGAKSSSSTTSTA